MRGRPLQPVKLVHAVAQSPQIRGCRRAGRQAPGPSPFRPGHASGATFITSSTVVNPEATFIAPDTRNGFIPSL